MAAKGAPFASGLYSGCMAHAWVVFMRCVTRFQGQWLQSERCCTPEPNTKRRMLPSSYHMFVFRRVVSCRALMRGGKRFCVSTPWAPGAGVKAHKIVEA